MAFPEAEKKQDKKEKPMTKVIIRRLPPTMDQETFLNQVSPIPDYSYIYLVKGDSSLGEYAFTRVYINFVNPEDIYDFKERFDNYVFVDAKGNEYPAVVEFAPFQKIPKKRGKVRMDPKCGSIESDPIYQEFVESLSKPKEQDEKPEYTLQLSVSTDNKNDITTPLLEYIKNKRAQRMRIREVRREERKRREFERKKERYDERKKPGDEKLIGKNVSSKPSTPKLEATEDEKNEAQEISEAKAVEKREKVEKTTEKSEKVEKTYEKSYFNKNKDRRYEERKYDDRKYDDRKYEDRKYDDRKYEDRKYDDRRKDIKPRYPRKEFSDNRDYKRSDDYRPKYEDYKKEEKGYPKKVKKYSERREERKMEVQKAEQMKNEKLNALKKEDKSKEMDDKEKAKCKTIIEKAESPKVKLESDDKSKEIITKEETETKPKESDPVDQRDCSSKIQENEDRKRDEEQKRRDLVESNSQKRIRNKDRPTIAIYRPGMLSKRKQNETDSLETKDTKS